MIAFDSTVMAVPDGREAIEALVAGEDETTPAAIAACFFPWIRTAPIAMP
jgi:hypothetical protein